MESDSDSNSSNRSEGDHSVVEEMNNSDDEEERSVASSERDDDEDIIIVDDNPNLQYLNLVQQLDQNESPQLIVWHRGVFDLILDNIDEFCTVLSSSQGITSVELGDVQGDDAGQKLQVTEDNSSAWNKLFQTLGNMSSAVSLLLGGYNLSGMLMSRLVEAMPNVAKLELYLPWYTISGEDMRGFVDAVSLHPCQKVDMSLLGDFNDGRELDEQTLSAEPSNRLEKGSILSTFLHLPSVKFLSVNRIKFTRDECKEFERIFSSDMFQVRRMWLEECSFGGGGTWLARAFVSANASLKILQLTNMFQDKAFCDELVSSLPRNRSIQSITFDTSRTLPTPTEHENKLDVVQLIKNVARRNETITHMRFSTQEFCMLQEKDVQELQQDIQQNYSLQYILIGYEEPFQAILKLNKAGRHYLAEDATSSSKCIAVLAKVKNELDCLYFHLRENPILCMSFCGNGGDSSVVLHATGRKRKADRAGVKGEAALERKHR